MFNQNARLCKIKYMYYLVTCQHNGLMQRNLLQTMTYKFLHYVTYQLLRFKINRIVDHYMLIVNDRLRHELNEHIFIIQKKSHTDQIHVEQVFLTITTVSIIFFLLFQLAHDNFLSSFFYRLRISNLFIDQLHVI